MKLSDPAVVLLDEPLSGLDPRGIRAARAEILELKERGAAVVLSSHLLDLIEALADRLLILDRGRVRFEGTLQEARSAAEGASLEDVFFAVTSGGEAPPRTRRPVHEHRAFRTDAAGCRLPLLCRG